MPPISQPAAKAESNMHSPNQRGHAQYVGKGNEGPMLASKHPCFLPEINDEIDIGVAQGSRSATAAENSESVEQHLAQTLPNLLRGGTPEHMDLKIETEGRHEIFRHMRFPQRGGHSTVGQRPRTTKANGSRKFSTSHRPLTTRKTAFIALGSNMGNRLINLEQACRQMDTIEGIRVRRTSGLWQTRAMYVTDQDDFLNGVCEIETSLEPLELLDHLQAIENALGRKRTIDKGPRTLDLDILLYDGQQIMNDRLTVPHKFMLERSFVLQPLCELVPQVTASQATLRTFYDYLQQLESSSIPMSPVVKLSDRAEPLTPLLPTRRTQVMSILNVTPDSFSDGGIHDPSDESYLDCILRAHLTAGATILDIGGQSTRPRAAPVTPEDEIARVVPAIGAARSLIGDPDNGYTAAISIDTYRSQVAKAAVEAGADIINDVSGGTLDPDMLRVMAEVGCTVVIMHMRGTPETMASSQHTTYDGDLIKVIGRELLHRLEAAEEAGIRRWRIILDPGIGFAKTAAQNLEILRRFGELRNFDGLKSLPWLVGASRKGFVGKITGVEAAEQRTWGTAATVAASVQGGADVIRVHDIDEMAKVAKMSDAIWRA